jgi:cytidylate kinase
MNRTPVVAIDGPAASGKGTVARELAAILGFAHLDTGLLYRAVGLAVIRAGANPADPAHAAHAAAALDLASLEDPALRGDLAGTAASKVAAVPAVRAALLDFQRNFASAPPGGKGAVLDGRDIGTVICPDADVKLFITASAEIRARRRYLELARQGSSWTELQVLDDIRARDLRDTSRPVAPLAKPADAHLLDTSDLDIETAVARALSIVRAALGT